MSKLIESALVWKLALVYGCLFALNAVAMSTVSALSGVDHWDNLLITQKVVIFMSIGANVTTTIMAFLNKSISRIEQGQMPLGSDTNPPFKPEAKP